MMLNQQDAGKVRKLTYNMNSSAQYCDVVASVTVRYDVHVSPHVLRPYPKPRLCPVLVFAHQRIR